MPDLISVLPVMQVWILWKINLMLDDTRDILLVCLRSGCGYAAPAPRCAHAACGSIGLPIAISLLPYIEKERASVTEVNVIVFLDQYINLNY